VCSVGTVKEDLCTHQALSNVYIEIIIVVVILLGHIATLYPCMNNVSNVAWSVCVSVSAAKTDEFLRCHLWCGLVGPKEPLGGGPDPPSGMGHLWDGGRRS